MKKYCLLVEASVSLVFGGEKVAGGTGSAATHYKTSTAVH